MAINPSEKRDVVTKDQIQVKKPKMFKVILLNDDYTTMEFVVYILQTVFHKSVEVAFELMWQVHTKGQGLCGVFTFEIAEAKVLEVTQLARQQEYPLKCIMEEA